jgi:hypothetical protein
MEVIALVFALAVIVEGIIEYLGTPLPSQFKPYAAALLGVAVCVAYNADVLALLGRPAQIPFVGAILTGLLIGRGSNYLHDVLTRINIVQMPAVTTDRVSSTDTKPGI